MTNPVHVESSGIQEMQLQFREHIRTHANLQNESADRLTLAAVRLEVLKRYAEGFFGKQAVQKAMREAKALRQSDPKAYEKKLEENMVHMSDFRTAYVEARKVERLLSTDVIAAVGDLRDSELNDPRPEFTTNLYKLVYRRERNNLDVLKTRGGVQLRDPFLETRAEGTTHRKTSWFGTGENYYISNQELGVELTWEALKSAEKYNEFLDAVYELGQNAARTRALMLLLAVHRSAQRITLPDGGLGPTAANIQAADAALGTSVINGTEYSRTLTDIFVPTNQRGIAATAMASSTVAYVGGAGGAVQALPTANPIAGLANVNPEAIFSIARSYIEREFQGHSGLDWIAADATTQPIEMAYLAGYATGPRVMNQISDIQEGDLQMMGSFDEHVIEVKITDWVGAAVRDKSGIVLMSGKND